MGKINVLDSVTVDKIAAGEVVERPESVVKELVENAIDSGATMITVEIRDGGISLIRVTDNGSGIHPEDVKRAFLRHATSKIETAEDLEHILSLGFRGEALSSIAAVCQVELITKTESGFLGIRANCNGGLLDEIEEVGAPNGTTVIARNIFFNTPVRRNFLRAAITEASYVTDLMQHLALSRPDIAFKFIANGQTKFYTSGNGDLQEIIYRIYGKETADNLIPVCEEMNGVLLEGYLGKPVLNRSNRSYETFFVNGRYVKSVIISDALEEGYREYVMQHKYPFVVLHFTIDTAKVDVNVHPTKMDIRINNPAEFVQFIMDTVRKNMRRQNLIPEIHITEKPLTAQEIAAKQKALTKNIPEAFEQKRAQNMLVREAGNYNDPDNFELPKLFSSAAQTQPATNIIKQKDAVIVEKMEQVELFDADSLLSKESKEEYEILGQLFDTYWVLSFRDKMFLVDQHAAHEKVRYESLLKHIRNKEITSQILSPPMIVTLTDREIDTYMHLKDIFFTLGFEIEGFGGNEFAIRSVPSDLYGHNARELFLSVIDELVTNPVRGDHSLILEKVASMACKSAVKGNQRLSMAEAKSLMDHLLELENPYQCPHGRPTIISISKYEIEKKFKRII